MSVDTPRAADAFLRFFNTFELSQTPESLEELTDGSVVHQVLIAIDPDYFTHSFRPLSSGENAWVDRLNSLKRVYRHLTQFYSDVLQQPTARLDVPDLNAIAKDANTKDILQLCRLTIAAAVQSDRKKEVIERIQSLSDEDQHYLMRAIEQVMSRLNNPETPRSRVNSMTEDDHYYQLQSERSKALMEKEATEKAFEDLTKEHQILQASLEDSMAEKQEFQEQLRHARRELDDLRHERADAAMRAEIERLRIELQKTEDNLSSTEIELERQNTRNAELTHKVTELQPKADEAVRLKDRLDELKHAAEKLQKTENVMEKYKKKLEESADLRRRIKSLEEQNASLVDKNASLEEDYRKVATYKPLIESYRSQISDLETKISERNKELDKVKFELEQATARLRITSEERAKDSETLDLYQERVRELELSTSSRPGVKPSSVSSDNNTEMTLEELSGTGLQDLSGELEDAITGTTATDLKLQIHRLKRELEAAKTNQADSSRILVLENLLADANRMKARYEQDYLASHRENLLLQSKLEEIRSGKGGDGAEAAIALRQRLNEVVEELDKVRKEYNELSVRFESQSKELIVVKSDLNLVNKDQLEILATLRESVSEDKQGLEAEIEKLRDKIKDMMERNRMQLEQINSLLIEKVNMQTESIGQREKMLERERDFSDLQSSLAGHDLPKDIKNRLLNMHEDNVILKEQVRTLNEKLTKAKAFIKNQDQLFKAEAAAKFQGLSPAAMEEVETRHSHDKKDIVAENSRLKEENSEMKKIYQNERQIYLRLIHHYGMNTLKGHLSAQQQQNPKSWLRQQRQSISQTVRRS